MMANWDLETLACDLPKLSTPLALIVARGDKAVAPAMAEKIRTRVAQAQLDYIAGVGHLAHEEKPGMMCDRIFQLATANAAWPPD